MDKECGSNYGDERALSRFDESEPVTRSKLQEIGFRCDGNQGECRSKFALHLDAYAWVKRDSYLPQGSQGLKVSPLFLSDFNEPLLSGGFA